MEKKAPNVPDVLKYEFVFVLAALEVDHIASGRVNGTKHIEETIVLLKRRNGLGKTFLESLDVALKDESGVGVDDIVTALTKLLTSREDVPYSLMWHTRDFCCRLGKEIARRTLLTNIREILKVKQ